MQAPQDLQVIGKELAIRWADGSEDFLPTELLRAASPSASNIGEPDILGRWHGGDSRKQFPGVTIIDWAFVGNYAVRFTFSDGHSTGIFSYKYLKQIADSLKSS